MIPAAEDWFSQDYIHGDRFVGLADIAITSEKPEIHERLVSEGRVVFCMTDLVPSLFARLRHRKRPCILITHNADISVTRELVESRPPCVRHWFAQNLVVAHPDVTPIPIGLERPHVSGGRARPEVFTKVAREPRELRNLAYMNHSTRTNRRARLPIDLSLGWRRWVTWAGPHLPFEEYLRELYGHRVVISPRGNGLDCHRTWEALYLGVVPIVEAVPGLSAFAASLPMIAVPSLRMLSRAQVDAALAGLERDPAAAMEMLRFSGWAERITRTRDRLA